MDMSKKFQGKHMQVQFKLNKQMYQRVMQLKKKYLMLFFTNEIVEVRKFCKMEMIREKHNSNNGKGTSAAANGNQ